jgi:hypothetical protein
VTGCMAFIREALRDGPLPVRDLAAWCDKEGFSVATYRRACRRMGVRKTHERLFGGAWIASLPQ